MLLLVGFQYGVTISVDILVYILVAYDLSFVHCFGKPCMAKGQLSKPSIRRQGDGPSCECAEALMSSLDRLRIITLLNAKPNARHQAALCESSGGRCKARMFASSSAPKA